jgi:hypothetical protein
MTKLVTTMYAIANRSFQKGVIGQNARISPPACPVINIELRTMYFALLHKCYGNVMRAEQCSTAIHVIDLKIEKFCLHFDFVRQ